MKKVRQFPKEHPIGCGRKPPNWETTTAMEGLSGQEKLNQLHAFFLRNFEEELCGLYDSPIDEQGKYKGRAGKPRLVWKHVGGAPAQHHPSSGKEGRQLRLMQRRVEDVAWALNRQDPTEIEAALVFADAACEDTARVCCTGSKFGQQSFMAWWRLLLAQGHSGTVSGEAVELAKLLGLMADGIEKKACQLACPRPFGTGQRRPPVRAGEQLMLSPGSQRAGKRS